MVRCCPLTMSCAQYVVRSVCCPLSMLSAQYVVRSGYQKIKGLAPRGGRLMPKQLAGVRAEHRVAAAGRGFEPAAVENVDPRACPVDRAAILQLARQQRHGGPP